LLRLAETLDPNRCIVRGHGANPASLIIFAGMQFIPDAEMLVDHHRALAIEVKFLRNAWQKSLTNAIGQAAIYGFVGYAASSALLLDYRATAKADDFNFLGQKYGLSIIFKRRNHFGQFVS
jgi:hypothetical protein